MRVGFLAGLLMLAACGGMSQGDATEQPLTSLQQAGQRVIYSYSGPTPPQALLDAIRAGQAAGVIFFRQNIPSVTQFADVVQQLRQAQQASPVAVPLLLMTDQEGGKVRRLPGEPTLSAKQVGEAADPVLAAANAGIGAGENLRSAGLNVNLGPVLDVYDTAGNFIDEFERSFSNDPNRVTECAAAFMFAQQATGVAATAKHFPGLGSAAEAENTDLVPVTIDEPLSRLRRVDEEPYFAAIALGVKLVMVSWARYQALDADLPAGLSSRVVQHELRKRLGFDGVTITDALEAGALQAYGDEGQRAVMAAQAGMDLILTTAEEANGEAATAALAQALDSGQLDRATFAASVKRVKALRRHLF